MKSLLTILFTLSISFWGLSAQTGAGLAEEFTKLEEYLRNHKLTPEERKRILETNVINSVKLTLAHKYPNPKKDLKDIKYADMQTERPEGTNNLYVKYKNFIISYSYAVDPELYLTTPTEEMLLEKPSGADLNANHDEKQPSAPK
ncbi:MAG: hypothetical protein O9264_05410 [Leptospira sp.]|nr:hypothetical protein [Leptospira sp.]